MMHNNKSLRRWLTLLIALPVLVLVLYILYNERKVDIEGKTVLCIPVYGQSLALGEEAIRITDFNELITNTGGRVVTENIDQHFGYFDESKFKQWAKKQLHYHKRSFELSIYGMSEALAAQLGSDTVVCTFPGGRGATHLANLSRGSEPYARFLSDIEKACRLSADGGAKKFYVPAVCFMQGESDIADYPSTDFKTLLLTFKNDINQDIKAITKQTEDIRLIVYQTNALARGKHFHAEAFNCPETRVPQTFVDLLNNDTLFWASGPTYPYKVMREFVHIDAVGQWCIGRLASASALRIIRHEPRFIGLIPQTFEISDSDVIVRFHVPVPPLVFDTIQVSKAPNFGFSIIRNDNSDIASSVTIEDSAVRIHCTSSPHGCRLRYAVNGEDMKSGNRHGPRGNLRDSQGNVMITNTKMPRSPLHNWCYQFDVQIGQ